jgi:uncharacterized protein YkwD
MSVKQFSFAAFAFAAALLAGCGGGGSGSSPTPTAPVTAAPTSGASALPTLLPASTPQPSAPTSAATTTAAAVTMTGALVDYTSGVPIAGASIAIAPQNVSASPVPVATTAADGSFSAPLTSAGPIMVQISAGTGRAVLHRYFTIASTGTTAIGALKLVSLSAEDTAEIALINADRASHGGGRALIPDEAAMEVARFHAADMAGNTGLGPVYYTHNDRNGVSPSQRFINANGIGGDGETLCAGDLTYAGCEAAYIAEGPPPTGSFNHYYILTDPYALWIGVGSSQAAPLANGFANSTYYDEEVIQYPD